MSGYFKISALAVLILIASGVVMGAMKEEVKEKMIKGVIAMKEAMNALEEIIINDNEDVIDNNKHELSGLIKMINDDNDSECLPPGKNCTPNKPPFCCSGCCVFSAWHRGDICVNL